MTGLIFFIFAASIIIAGIAAIIKPSTLLGTIYHVDRLDDQRRKDKARSARTTGVIMLLVGALLASLPCTTIVPPRTVGVVTAFGKPTGTLPNGLHAKFPWEKVSKMDASLQTNRYSDDTAINVRLANQSEARADASIQWQLREEDAQRMYLDYREFERIQSDLVDREFRASVNAVLSTYNPLDPEAIAEGGIDLGTYADDIKDDMQKRMGKAIEVRSVALPIVTYDEKTQQKIDQLQSEVANTRAAEQSKKTAQEIAEANDIMQRSLSPEVLAQRCIEAAEKVGAAPVGCIPGAGATPLVDMRKN